MKKENLTLQEERRREKDIRRAKRKEQNQKERTQRLAHQNPARIERQLADLERRDINELTTSERTQLKDLKHDLKHILQAKKKTGTDYKPRDHSVIIHNKRSIYYDPELNQSGVPPAGWPRKTVQEVDSDDGYTTSESVSCIPLPQKQTSGAKKLNNKKAGNSSQTVYESEPQLRDFTKEQVQFVPTTLAKKRRKTQSVGSNAVEILPTNKFPVLPGLYSDEDEDEDEDRHPQPQLEDVSDDEEH